MTKLRTVAPSRASLDMDEAPVASVAPLANVVRLRQLIDRVQNRQDGLPGMGTFYGPSGLGKSTASIWCTQRHGAVYVQVKSCWTARKLCEAILIELGMQLRPMSIGDMVDRIAEQLASLGVPLLIDEADHLVNRRMVELVRDIHESSLAPVILIGEEALPQKLRQWERVHGRMLDWVAAEPGTLQDVGHLARIYASGIVVAPDLQAAILKASGGSIRRIAVNLARVKDKAKLQGVAAMDLAAWQDGDWYTGSAPAPRRLAS